MFSTLSPGALGLSLDHPTAIDLAVKHGFGGVDPDPAHFRTLGSRQAVVEHGEAKRRKGLQWGMGGACPCRWTAPPRSSGTRWWSCRRSWT